VPTGQDTVCGATNEFRGLISMPPSPVFSSGVNVGCLPDARRSMGHPVYIQVSVAAVDRLQATFDRTKPPGATPDHLPNTMLELNPLVFPFVAHIAPLAQDP